MNPPTTVAAADPPGVVSLYQAHRKIHPRAVTGRFANLRRIVAWLTQIVFFGLPWLQWNGRPAVLFDIAARRFYVFDLVLHPQDFIYLTALLLVSAYALFLFTAVAGRLWCGYACPQTVYTTLFMWVERRFEGDRAARMKLDAAAWSGAKLARKAGKHAAWIVIALATGFTFAGYFTPIGTLATEAAAGTLGAWQTFWILFYSFATWGNAGFMREQVCKYMCPYARFQSAMFDRDTLIISYDSTRGEPRGSRSKKADTAALGLGACVDCGLCVQVCPTGIDIRKGLQYECIGCAACVDVCDGVMDKMNYPRGLVRYDTLNGLAGHLTPAQRLQRVLRPRVLVYGAVLLAISGAVAVALVLRAPFKADVVRDRASLARIVGDGYVENVYRLQLMNATEASQSYAVDADGLPGLALPEPVRTTLAPAEARWVTVTLRVPPEAAARTGPGVHPVSFTIERLATATQPAHRVKEKSTFVLPR